MNKPGPLLILSGPSGSGKSTIVRRLVQAGDLPLRLAVSATTRPPRTGEKDGVDYFFWTPQKFAQEIEAGAFLEWAQVHGKDYYGTLRREVDDYRRQGIGVILDIDVQGAEQVRRQCPDCVSVFLQAPSLVTYEHRLRQRGTEDEAAIECRLANAQEELKHAPDYDFVVVNDNLEAAAAEVHDILSLLFAFEKGDENAR